MYSFVFIIFTHVCSCTTWQRANPYYVTFTCSDWLPLFSSFTRMSLQYMIAERSEDQNHNTFFVYLKHPFPIRHSPESCQCSSFFVNVKLEKLTDTSLSPDLYFTAVVIT